MVIPIDTSASADVTTFNGDGNNKDAASVANSKIQQILTKSRPDNEFSHLKYISALQMFTHCKTNFEYYTVIIPRMKSLISTILFLNIVFCIVALGCLALQYPVYEYVSMRAPIIAIVINFCVQLFLFISYLVIGSATTWNYFIVVILIASYATTLICSFAVVLDRNASKNFVFAMAHWIIAYLSVMPFGHSYVKLVFSTIVSLALQESNQLLGDIYGKASNYTTLGTFANETFIVITISLLEFAVSFSQTLTLMQVFVLHQKKKKELKYLEIEKEQNMQLLLSSMPHNIIDRMISGETNIYDTFQRGTVLFAELVGFEDDLHKNSKAAIMFLDHLFTLFDAQCDVFNCTKIKSIQSIYMVVGGIEKSQEQTHEVNMALLALKMIEISQEAVSKRTDADKQYFGVRIGMTSGPFCAGVLGHSKFLYDGKLL